MKFGTSVKVCFSKSIVISGRASRSEFWWFQLARLLVSLVPIIGWLFTIFTILPSITVTIRRLHDTNRSGWYLLPLFVLPTAFFYSVIFPIASTRQGATTIVDMFYDSPNEFIISSINQQEFGPAFLLLSVVFGLYSLMVLWWLIKDSDKKTNDYGLPSL